MRNEIARPVPRTSAFWRLFYTLCYHHPSQLAWRFKKRTWDQVFVDRQTNSLACDGRVRDGQEPLFQALLRRRLAGRRSSIRQNPDAVRAGMLCFLGQNASLAAVSQKQADGNSTPYKARASTPYKNTDPDQAIGDIAWHRVHELDVDHLWRFHLHYHEFLFDLLPAQRGQGLVTANHAGDTPTIESSPIWPSVVWSHVQSWIDCFPAPTRSTAHDAWHPFCIARRIPVWVMLWHAAPPPSELEKAIRNSVYLQADYLRRHLELDLGGNHLLENLRALTLAAAFFDTSQWLDTVDGHLRRELPEQCLDSGEHFERAPAYHAIVLELLLEIRDVTKELRPTLATFLDPYVDSMQKFLGALCHPDGEIPLFSDSTLGSGPMAPALLERSSSAAAPDDSNDRRQDAVCSLSDPMHFGGYWVWRSHNDALIFDGGQAAVDSLPAHAHCDLLNLEASVGGERVIVDGGVFDYGDTDMRRYCRSTQAHNVLEVDGVDQFDVWSRFRMGYRGHVVQYVRGEAQGWCWARASHNAYRRLGVPSVSRWVGCCGAKFLGEDFGTEDAAGSAGREESWVWWCLDSARGRGEHRFANRVKVHPTFAVEKVTERRFRLTSERQTVWLEWMCASGTVEVEDGWYCPEFGQRHRASVITWRDRGRECHSAWAMSMVEMPAEWSVERALKVARTSSPW